MIARGYEAGHSGALRARLLVDRALSGRRMAHGLSTAAPALRAFAGAGACSLMLWAAILRAAGVI